MDKLHHVYRMCVPNFAAKYEKLLAKSEYTT